MDWFLVFLGGIIIAAIAAMEIHIHRFSWRWDIQSQELDFDLRKLARLMEFIAFIGALIIFRAAIKV